MMGSAYRVAVIGAGGIAGRHLAALWDMAQAQCVAIADLNREKAETNARMFGVQAYQSYTEMLEREKPDIAIVTLPHHLHREAVEQCAARGIHLLLEKPMGISVAECDVMMQAAAAGGVTLLIGHTQHYLPENRAAKEWIDAGWLGRLIQVQDTRHTDYFAESRPEWFFRRDQAGGGILANLGSHCVDKLQWLSGQRVVRVTAQVDRHAPIGDVEGAGVVMLLTEGGIPATVCMSGYKGAPRNETELCFAGGMLRLASGGLWVSEGGDFRQVELPPGQDPFLLQMEDLIAAIESGKQPECHPAYSRSLVAVTEAIYQSAETGQAVDL